MPKGLPLHLNKCEGVAKIWIVLIIVAILVVGLIIIFSTRAKTQTGKEKTKCKYVESETGEEVLRCEYSEEQWEKLMR